MGSNRRASWSYYSPAIPPTPLLVPRSLPPIRHMTVPTPPDSTSTPTKSVSPPSSSRHSSPTDAPLMSPTELPTLKASSSRPTTPTRKLHWILRDEPLFLLWDVRRRPNESVRLIPSNRIIELPSRDEAAYTIDDVEVSELTIQCWLFHRPFLVRSRKDGIPLSWTDVLEGIFTALDKPIEDTDLLRTMTPERRESILIANASRTGTTHTHSRKPSLRRVDWLGENIYFAGITANGADLELNFYPYTPASFSNVDR